MSSDLSIGIGPFFTYVFSLGIIFGLLKLITHYTATEEVVETTGPETMEPETTGP